MSYLDIFWSRLKQGSLCGESTHVIRTVDRLVELWACLEIIRTEGLVEANPMYLAPVVPPDARHDYPAMGVRIIDGAKTLFSLPAPQHGESRYSSWVQSERLSRFADHYIDRIKQSSTELSTIPPVGIRPLIERAFHPLNAAAGGSAGNYGILNTLERLEIIKNRMLGWAEKGTWLPVIG